MVLETRSPPVDTPLLDCPAAIIASALRLNLTSTGAAWHLPHRMGASSGPVVLSTVTDRTVAVYSGPHAHRWASAPPQAVRSLIAKLQSIHRFPVFLNSSCFARTLSLSLSRHKKHVPSTCSTLLRQHAMARAPLWGEALSRPPTVRSRPCRSALQKKKKKEKGGGGQESARRRHSNPRHDAHLQPRVGRVWVPVRARGG